VPAEASPGHASRAAVHSTVVELAARHGLEMTPGDDLRAEILRIFDETFAVTSVLLGIALLVASLGIATSLTILVLERKHQLGTLLALGASTGQLRAIIIWEAMLMVSVGATLGLICGFLLSYLLIYVINLQSFGWTFIYRVDWATLLWSLPLVFGAALLSALPAAHMALHTPPALVLRDR
jgi:putative ABC transport system permease protein